MTKFNQVMAVLIITACIVAFIAYTWEAVTS
jgi:hypothetical protein